MACAGGDHGCEEQREDFIAVGIDADDQPVAERGVGEEADRAAVERAEARGDAGVRAAEHGQRRPVRLGKPETGDRTTAGDLDERVGALGDADLGREGRTESQAAGAEEPGVETGRLRGKRGEADVAVVVVLARDGDAAGLQARRLIEGDVTCDGDREQPARLQRLRADQWTRMPNVVQAHDAPPSLVIRVRRATWICARARTPRGVETIPHRRVAWVHLVKRKDERSPSQPL